MEYNYNFLDFFDSPDIAAYNKNTVFTPAEQAILISLNESRSIADKIDALQYLVDTFSDKDFHTEEIVQSFVLDKNEDSLRGVTIHKIESWKRTLEKRFDTKNIIFVAVFTEQGFFCENVTDVAYFSTYDAAYQYLQVKKQHYLDDEDLCEVPVYGKIKRLRIDQPESYDREEYWFDHNLELVEILDTTSLGVDGDGNMIPDLSENFYVHVPIPFKKGDLVKSTSLFYGDTYGIMSRTYEEKDQDRHFSTNLGDASDIIVSLDVYDEKMDLWDWTDDTSRLSLHHCTEQEIEVNRIMVREWKTIFGKDEPLDLTMSNTEQAILQIIKNEWDEIILSIQKKHELSDVSFRTWLKPLYPLAIKGKVLIVNVYDDLMKNYVEKKYEQYIVAAFKERLQMELKIQFSIRGLT